MSEKTSSCGGSDSLHSSGHGQAVAKIKHDTHTKRFRWKSKLDFIISTMACTFSMYDFDAFIISAKNEEIGFTQFAVWAIFFCVPLIYMQLLLGQYTQLGTVLFKYVSPIGYGVGYVLICNLFLRTLKSSLLLNDSVFYFMSSFRSQLQWMNCSSRYKIPCWDETKTCQNCINTTYYLPGYIYFFFHYMENPELDPKKMRLSLPSTRKAITHFVCWSVTCILLMAISTAYVRAIKNIWRICFALLVLLILGCVVPDGRRSFVNLFLVGTESITSFSSWTNSLGKVITLFGLGRAFHIVHGSFMTNDSPVGLLSLIVVIAQSLLSCACSVLTIACVNRIAHYTYTNEEHLTQISWETGTNTYFFVLPQGLGFMGVPQLWSCIYFGICILININQQITHLITIEKALSDVYPNLIRYRKYVLICFCIMGCMTSYLFLSREAFLIYKAVCYRISDTNEMFNVIMMCILICWIYGVQRFCDDIHFITGRQTTKFWKICWYILPFLVIVAHGEIIFIQKSLVGADMSTMDVSLYFIFASPVPIMAIIQTFKFIKKRDLFGLFQPQERFGPADPHERQLRRLFNPRKETRSKRRTDTCNHPCLITSHELMVATNLEDNYRHEFSFKEIEDYESDDFQDDF